MIFQFRMLCDEDDYFVREYEVPYDMTLAAFRDFIDRDLRYGPENLTSFFTADARWNKLQEFTATDMDMEDADGEQIPATMDGTLLSQVIHKNHDRLIYEFDVLGERAFFLELTAALKAETGKRYPVVTLSEGDAPDQDAPGGSGGGSIFDDAMGDFNDFAGDDGYGNDE